MAQNPHFDGFSPVVLDFYRQLAANNDRQWFDAHRSDFRQVMAQAQDFVVDMGQRLREIVPSLVYDTRTNGSGSIFRVYRDVRFSRDKTPYKTHLGIFFWDGAWSKGESPGFYFQLEPERIGLYAGMYEFSRPVLERFRNQVVDARRGRELNDAVKRVTDAGPYRIGGQHYQRVPRGYDPQHSNAQWLLHNDLYAVLETGIPDNLDSPGFVDDCFRAFRDMAPIHLWLVGLLAP